jgi:mycofactocin precursor peptide peptidase
MRGRGDWRDLLAAPTANFWKTKFAHARTTGAQQVNSSYHRRVAFPTELGNSTTRQLHGTSPALIIPVGSTEQHGPHLPLDTDTRIASAVARGAAERLAEADHDSEWMLAPPIGYGASGEHESFSGTVSIGISALRLLLVEFGRSAASWASRLVFVNGHGGNVEALAGAAALLRYEGRDVGWCPCGVENADAHAGHTETSVLLHISPEAVRLEERVPGNRTPLAELLPAMRSGGVAAVSELGVLGDPTTATVVDGERLYTEMVEGCVRRIERWSPDRDGMLT